MSTRAPVDHSLLMRELQAALATTLEVVTNSPISVVTPLRFKIVDDGGSTIFTLLKFEARLDA